MSLPALRPTPALAAEISRRYGAERLAAAINTLAWEPEGRIGFRYLLEMAGPVLV